MLRPLYIVLLIVGLAAGTYATWSWHRISDEVLVEDRGWPRALPYPDYWLLALNDWFDARYPAPRGAVKLDGEVARVRATVLAALSISAGVAVCGGLPLTVPWLRRLCRTRGFEVVAGSRGGLYFGRNKGEKKIKVTRTNGIYLSHNSAP